MGTNRTKLACFDFGGIFQKDNYATPYHGVLTVITEESLASLEHIMKRYPSAPEWFLLDMMKEENGKLSLRSIQRMKQQLRKMTAQEKRDLLVLYYQGTIKQQLWIREGMPCLYEDYARALNIVEVPIEMALPLYPPSYQDTIKKWLKMDEEIQKKLGKILKRTKVDLNSPINVEKFM